MSVKTQYCVARNCHNSNVTHPEYSFFLITQERTRRAEWLRRIGRSNWMEKKTAMRRICEVHFDPNDIIFVNNKKKLTRTAFPKQKHKRKTEPKESSSVALTAKIEQTNTPIPDNRYETKFNDLCCTYLTEELAQLVKASAFITSKSEQDRKLYWKFCWDLYQTSPQAYQFIGGIYGFPAVTSLVKQHVPTGTEFYSKLMLSIKSRVDKMNKKENNCCVVIRCIGLKASLCYNIKEDKIIGLQEISNVKYPTPTKKAVIIMIRGILYSWKHNIGYLLLPDSGYDSKIGDWIDNILNSLFVIGLNVRAVISALDDDLINESLKIKKVSVENPYLIINGKKVFHIYNAKDLMIAIRDNLIVNDFYYHESVAKYEHIVDFYDKDKKVPKIAHKLTNKHICPTETERKEGLYAIQLLSSTVARGIWNFANFKLISEEAKGTAEFISKIDRLFDILNATKRRNEDKYKKAYCGNEIQALYLEEMIMFFKELKVMNPCKEDVTCDTKFIHGFLTTIKSIMLLFDDLKAEGFTFLPTGNLNSKCVETFISQMGSKMPNNLTTQQFITKHRKLFIAYHKKFTLGGNSENELNKLIKQIQKQREEEREMSKKPETTENTDTCNNDVNIKKEDYMDINTHKKHSLFYICGYLLIKSRENHNTCSTLLDYMTLVKRESPSDFKYLRYKQYLASMHPEKLLAVPCDGFVQFVEQMDVKFIEAFENRTNFKIIETVYDAIQKVEFNLPCPCFPKTYMIKLFLRIKIFYTVRRNNRAFRKNRDRMFTVPSLQ